MRPFRPDDIDALFSLWTDPDVRHYLWDGEFIPEAKAQETLDNAIRRAEQPGIGMWTIMLREFIGFW